MSNIAKELCKKEKIHEKYNVIKGKSTHFLILFFTFFTVGAFGFFEEGKVRLLGVTLFSSLYFPYCYLLYFYLKEQELARNSEGLILLLSIYLGLLLYTSGVIFGLLTKNIILVSVYIFFTIILAMLFYFRHLKLFNSMVEVYIKEQKIDIVKGFHNIAKIKGRGRWSRILFPKTYNEKQNILDYKPTLLQWSFIINAITIALCEYFSQNFKFYIISVTFYAVSLFLLYIAIFQIIVLRFILKKEKEHGYEFKIVYDPDPVQKKPTRAQERKKERMLERERLKNKN